MDGLQGWALGRATHHEYSMFFTLKSSSRLQPQIVELDDVVREKRRMKRGINNG
jgi:hypothetical protein